MGKFFIARPIFAIALAAAIVLLGIISIFDLPIYLPATNQLHIV